MIFLSPWGLLGLIAVPMILLLYILKQKREKQTVSSLILWRRVLDDMQARTPWQKLRKNLLLFLQIAAALLLVLVLAGLALKTGKTSGESYILAVDCSLSMSSTDTLPSRFDAAVKDAVRFAEDLPADSRISVVSLGREANVLLYNSTSMDEAVQSLQSIRPTNSWLDKSGGEEILLSLKKQDAAAQIVLFGDNPLRVGNETVQFSNYRKENDNAALIRFTHTVAQNRISGMSIVRNQSGVDRELAVSLYGDDRFLDSQRVTVPANQTQTIWWQDIPVDVATLRCVIDTPDSLMPDNTAWDAVSREQTTGVLIVSEGNIFLDKVFSLMEGVEVVRTLPEDMQAYQGYDLYILDGVIPDKLPADGHIIIFNPPPGNRLIPVGDWMDLPEIRPVENPIFRYLDNFNFSIARTRIMEEPEWAENILESNGNPIIMEGQLDKTRLLVFGFNLYETDLPLRSEFPILMSNILSEYAPGRSLDISGLLTGDTATFRLDPEASGADIVYPDESRLSIAPPFPPEEFDDTMVPGIYRLEQTKQDETADTDFAVNLPDEWLMENTADTTPDQDVQSGFAVPIKNKVYPLAWPILLLILMLLSVEWWYYANRHYV